MELTFDRDQPNRPQGHMQWIRGSLFWSPTHITVRHDINQISDLFNHPKSIYSNSYQPLHITPVATRNIKYNKEPSSAHGAIRFVSLSDTTPMWELPIGAGGSLAGSGSEERSCTTAVADQKSSDSFAQEPLTEEGTVLYGSSLFSLI